MARRRAIAALILVLAGCKNQSGTTISNPFLTPDRVPPPSTRVLAPGTAQPYYPGDPMPGAAAYQPPVTQGYSPATGFPPAGGYAPPAQTYGAPAYGAPAAGGATPPGGWGTSPPSQQQYAPPATAPAYQPQYSVPPSGYSPGYGVTPTGAELSSANLSVPAGSQPRLPIQRMLGEGSEPSSVGATLSAIPPAAPAWNDPQFRPAGFTDGTATLSAGPIVGSDGFRPRGSTPTPGAAPAGSGFQPPEITRAGVESNPYGALAERYSVDAAYTSLRGQLVLDGATGMLFIHYMITGGDPYGGVLPLANPEVVAGLLPGDYVKLAGQVFTVPRDDGTQMPVFRVNAVERQRQ
ncbi:MAG: hypothetical protein KF847_11860 [Pirellulales bacterium]|nr:hypothetical protein [Pirellulales bacterium]